jgi:hypothetical protein
LGGVFCIIALSIQSLTSTIQKIISETLNALCSISQLICMPKPSTDKWTVIAELFEERWNLLTAQERSMGHISEYDTHQTLDQFLININFTTV